MTQIESKEIRGISARTIITIVVATASIVATVLATAASISAQITKVDTKVEILKIQYAGDERLKEARIKTIEVNLETINQFLMQNKKNNK